MFNLCFLLPFLLGLVAALLGWWLRKLWGQGIVEKLEGEISTQKQSYASLKTDYDGFSGKYNALNSKYAAVEDEKLALHKEWEGEAKTLNLNWETKYNLLQDQL